MVLPREPAVTVVCATFGARDTVRLMLGSFRRCTPEPVTFLVADNGSIDGTLADLRQLDWLSVTPVEERRAEARDAARALNSRFDELVAGLSPRERMLLSAARCRLIEQTAAADTDMTDHGATLDWLAARVSTPYLLTLDSDVEFLEPGWLSAMLEHMEREQLDALGEYEPGLGGYRPRVAPYVFLLRTDTERALGASFHGFVRHADAEAERRWRARPASLHLDASEVAAFSGTAIYPTAAGVFEALERTGRRWADTPEPIRRMYRHLGRMSWAATTDPARPGGANLRDAHAARLACVEERLAAYTWPP